MGTEQLDTRVALRKHYRQKRLLIPKTLWQEQSLQICDTLASWDIWQDLRLVFSFLSHQREPDLAPLMLRCPHKTWALPRCHHDLLQFHQFDANTALVPNHWGILEPPSHAPVITPDRATLCLVPGLVFDRRGYRLGFGKGYYDRYFHCHPHCLKVGVVLPGFLIDHTHPQPWDVRMDFLVYDGTIEPVQN